MDDAEDGGVGADAYREGDDGDGGEAGGLEQCPEGVTEVVKNAGSAGQHDQTPKRAAQRYTVFIGSDS